MIDIDRLLADLDQRMRGLRAPMTSDVHEVRRALSHQLRGAEPHAVLTLANALVARDGAYDRFSAYEIVTSHRPTRRSRPVGAIARPVVATRFAREHCRPSHAPLSLRPAAAVVPSALFTLALVVLTLRGLRPIQPLALEWFMALALAYGAIVDVIHSRWASRWTARTVSESAMSPYPAGV